MGKKEGRLNKGKSSLLYLVAIMAGVVLIVSYIWFNELYKTAIETERKWLLNSARSQARLMEAIALHEKHEGNSQETILEQITDTHKHYKGFGETGEFLLATREGDKIVFLLSYRQFKAENPQPTGIHSGLAIPMQHALEGKSGTVIGPDYQGVTVLAAFEPVAGANLGIVAKIDMKEIREPFVKAGIKAGAIALLLVLGGAGLFVYIIIPLTSKLQKSEAKMRHLFENVNDSIFIVDPETRRILEVNENAARRLGYSKKELLQLNADDIVSPDSAIDLDAAFKELKEGGSFIVERLHRRKDGTNLPVEISSGVIELDNRNVVLTFARDITERKKAEGNMKEKNILVQLLQKVAIAANESSSSEEALQTAIDLVCQFLSCPIGHVYMRSENSPNRLVPTSIWSMADKERFKVWHEKTMEVNFDIHVGLPGRVMASGKPAWIIDITEDSNFLRIQLAKDLGVKTGFAFPVMVHGKVEAVLEFFTSKTTEPFSELLEVMANVGVQLGRVIERNKAEEALLKNEEKYRLLFSSMLDGFALYEIVLDENNKLANYVFLELNHAFENLTGLKREDTIGKRVTEALQGIENDLAGWIGKYDDVALTGGNVRFEQYSETLNKWFSVHTFRPQINQFAVIFRDITERKRAEEEMIKTQKLESVGLLAGGIAHDFNNLLMLITGNISLIKTGLKEDDRTVNSLDRIERALARASGLTNQLLTFAKGGAPVIQTADISELIEDTSRFAVRGTNIKCKVEIEPSLHHVQVDTDQISQVIQNIVINAVHSMPEGGTVSIDTTSTKVDDKNELPLTGGDYLKISISDKGEGIPSEDIFKIFDPYFTTKTGGSGLGLSTSYSIIKKHNGLLTVESEVGEGSSFHIYLPVGDRSATAIEGKNDRTIKGAGRILVMDDEKKIREAIGEMLSLLEYAPTLTSNGEETIKEYKKSLENGEGFDAVILDLTIPDGMGGEETIKRLREINPDINAIVSSGYSNNPILSNHIDYGFNGVARKPYSIEKLSAVLETVLNSSENS